MKNKKPIAINKCNKCGKEQLPDYKQSNKNWNVYPIDEECKCGGIFKLEVIYGYNQTHTK